MAKKEKGSLSWDDFDAENLLNEEEEQEEEQEEEEEEQEEEEEETNSKKKKVKKKTAKKEEEASEEEEESEEEEKEEEETSKKTKPEEEEESEEEEQEKEEEEEDKDELDPNAFFEQIEKITGQEVEVDYGDVDPLTPQGFALREKAVREQALDNFLEEVQTKFPKAYMALMHANNGGDVAELFTSTSGKDYTKIEIGDNDQELAKEIAREYYQARGVKNQHRLEKLIEEDEDSENGLIDEARGMLKEMQEEQLEEQEKILTKQKEEQEAQVKRDQILLTVIDEVLDSKQLGSFRLTDLKEARQFKEYVVKNIRRTREGKYELSTPVDEKELEKALQYQYFQFKGGDLSKIIQQKAKSENAKRLKLKLKSEQQKLKKNTEEETGKKLSLRDFTR